VCNQVLETLLDGAVGIAATMLMVSMLAFPSAARVRVRRRAGNDPMSLDPDVLGFASASSTVGA
jgi:hypothetical protein